MASYLKNSVDCEGLPAINKTRFLDGGGTGADGRRHMAWNDDYQHGPSSYRPPAPANTGLYKHDPTALQPRPPSPTQSRRALTEIQDQLKTFKEEGIKKDALIQQLTSLDTNASVVRPSAKLFDPLFQFDAFNSSDYHAVEAARTELATVQVKNEKITSQVCNLQHELEAKEIKVRELQNIIETSRESEAGMVMLVQNLRKKLEELETKAATFGVVAGRGELAISNLQEENRECQEKIFDLETRLRKQLEEREKTEHKAQLCEKKYNELFTQISNILRHDVNIHVPDCVESLYRKLSDMVKENVMLKGKLVTLNELLANSELEGKASRETIMRLVSEVSREHKMTSQNTVDVETIRRERDNAVDANKDLEREVGLLQDRLNSCQRMLDAAQNELCHRDGRLTSLEQEMRESSNSVHFTNTQYSLFKDQLSSLLSDVYHTVEPKEDSIKEQIRHYQQKNKNNLVHMEALESKVKMLMEQLESQCELHQTAARRVKKTEEKMLYLQEKLQSTEGELAAGEILKDGFKSDKEKYLRCLQKLADIMKMNEVSSNLDLDMTIDCVIARAEQLVKLESSAVTNKSSHIYGLQRKIKGIKEQLESKDLHIELLRKKITSLEERLHGKSELEKERDCETMRVRKLEKLVEKYKSQLQEARGDITDLKSRLLGTSDLKVCSLEQKKDISELKQQVEELDQIRQKQAKKIASFKQELEFQEQKSQQKRVMSGNAVQTLSSELKTTKMALEAVTDREKQLLDFRSVVARMLGLDINTLAVPDYEIISRLEKLIQAHHTNTITSLGLEESLADMEDGFLSGYEEAGQSTGKFQPRHSRNRIRQQCSRARSMSPVRRDPRSY